MLLMARFMLWKQLVNGVVTVLVTVNGVYPIPLRFLVYKVLVGSVCVELCGEMCGEKGEDVC